MTRTRRFTLVASLVAWVVGVVNTPLHAQSPLDGFNPGANNDVHALAVQADGKILVGGAFTGLGGGTGTTLRNRIGRLNPAGTVDTTFDPGANGIVHAQAVQTDGKILVAGAFTTLGGGGTGTSARNYLGRLNLDGTLDTTFNPGANADVLTVAVQPDGKILVGGVFTMLGGGGTGTSTRHHLGRLHADGSLDTTFDPGANNTVHTVGLEPDGQIVVSGAFTMLGGGGTGTSTRHHLGRLHADGSLDSSFDPGANGPVRTSALAPDGRILVGGNFTMLGGGGTGTSARNYLGRLNPDGTLDTSFNPGANDDVLTVAVQPDGRILVGGDFTMLGGGGGTTARDRIGRLHPDGSLDTTFSPGANGSVFTLALQPDGKILVGGPFALLTGADVATRNGLGRLHSDGSLDVDLKPGANSEVYALAVQPDGKIVVGGEFTALGGGTGTIVRNGIGQLHPDGTIDTTFNPGANGPVFALAVQHDGKILVGGEFTALGDGTGTIVRNRIARLNPDGTVDTTFNPGADNSVRVLAVQPDGKILVGGAFTGLGGGTGTTTRNNIGRLNPDGTVDTTFNPGANNAVRTLAVRSDGKILVGGSFTGLGGGTGTIVRNHIGRLNADGTVDTTFDPGANNTVRVLAVQSDGKILVGGIFTGLGDRTGATTRNRIGRLNDDGTVDTTFNPGANDIVWTVAVQSGGQILVGGEFTALGDGTGTIVRNRIGRLNPDGTVDATFDPGANNAVYSVAVQADGRILVGGFFTGLGGGSGTTFRARIGRLTNTAAAIQRLSVACPGCVKGSGPSLNAAVTWTRSGGVPEVERVTFDLSADGVFYVPGGAGTRVAGEWRLTSATGVLGQHFYVRARGYYATGMFNASSSIVESIRQVHIACPAIAPASLPTSTVGIAYSATLTASGALGTVSFSTTSALPTGVLLSAAGVLAGTPTQAGTFPVTVIATDASSGCAGSRTYSLTINAATLPTMALDKTSLQFAGVPSTLLGVPVLVTTSAQAVRLTQVGAGTVTWTATVSHPWLTVSPSSGIGSATLSVAMASQTVPPYSAGTGAITFAFSGATNATSFLTVTLTLPPGPLGTLGLIDTPLENSTGVTGAVPFTGWALDSIEVFGVSLCRAVVTGETAPVDARCGGAAQIYVGDATFIDGARPDVLAAHPTYPRSSRAGWGFMVLTNMLPNQGNGTYVFYAYAFGRPYEALRLGGLPRVTLLGTRTMTCANASATKPFGAIDTPEQGGIASGSSFVNFGWALTPQPTLIPIDGSTMSVLIDGTPIGTVNYNHERADIEALFPNLQNTAGANGAVGFRVIDTTALTNGLHTISWAVTDSSGAIEGIGSRFFTVSNGAGAMTAGNALTAERGTSRQSQRHSAQLRMDTDVESLSLDNSAVVGRRGWDLAAPYVSFAAGGSGRVVVRSEEVNRVELRLGPAEHYSGHLRTSEGLSPLPIGSHLDATTGVFTWAPGVGFVGAYDLVFVRWDSAAAVARHEVRIILDPKGSHLVGPQVVIDAPRSQQDVGQPFHLGGWAADFNAASGTGIATLHAWAYPLTGGPPVFLGATNYGGARPDVAAVHGDQFAESGFGLNVQGLTPGNYDLAVFAWSIERGGFIPPRTVRVTVRP